MAIQAYTKTIQLYPGRSGRIGLNNFAVLQIDLVIPNWSQRDRSLWPIADREPELPALTPDDLGLDTATGEFTIPETLTEGWYRIQIERDNGAQAIADKKALQTQDEAKVLSLWPTGKAWAQDMKNEVKLAASESDIQTIVNKINRLVEGMNRVGEMILKGGPFLHDLAGGDPEGGT